MTPTSDRIDEAPASLIDEMCVRRLFARPDRLADSAFLRREIAGRMHKRLSYVRVAPGLVLDAGCGEGDDLPLLQARFPDARVIGVDFSAGLLHHARARSHADLVSADFGRLPLADGAAGLLWSNLALHWHARPQEACAEWLRVLKLGGLLMASCFGQSTLRELRAAFDGVDDCQHTLPFVDMHLLGNLLVATGFPSPVLDRETIIVTYDSVDRLLADVRAFGGNALVQRRRSLLGKRAWAQVRNRLENSRNAGGKIPLSFEIVYVHAFRDEPAQRPQEAPMVFMPRMLKPDSHA